MAAYEGFVIRVQKQDANFRQLGWLLMCSFGDSKKMPYSITEWWPLDIDNLFKEEKPKGEKLTTEALKELLKKLN